MVGNQIVGGNTDDGSVGEYRLLFPWWVVSQLTTRQSIFHMQGTVPVPSGVTGG